MGAYYLVYFYYNSIGFQRDYTCTYGFIVLNNSNMHSDWNNILKTYSAYVKKINLILKKTQ